MCTSHTDQLGNPLAVGDYIAAAGSKGSLIIARVDSLFRDARNETVYMTTINGRKTHRWAGTVVKIEKQDWGSKA